MLKIIAAAAVVAGVASGAALADGGGHSHSHSHPHDGHGVSSGAGYHHTHAEKVTGVEHTHEINGVELTHQHRRVQGFEASAAHTERVFRSRYQVGAGFGPYTVAEWQARVAAGQPGLFRRQEPWPTRRYRPQD